MIENILIQKGLSNREAEIASLIVKGLSNEEIGKQLGISQGTVKFHATYIYRKLHVKSRAQFIVSCLPLLNWSEL